MPEPSASSIAIYQLRLVLCGVSPLVWRRLLVVSTTSIAELHEILQSAFGWSGEHLHRFLIHGAAYGIPHLGGIVFREDARGVPLSRFRLHCGERFRYEYDFTADWKLDIRLERALPGFGEEFHSSWAAFIAPKMPTMQEFFPLTLTGLFQKLRCGEALQKHPGRGCTPVFEGFQSCRIILCQGMAQLIDKGGALFNESYFIAAE
jgi:hypothetical protein